MTARSLRGTSRNWLCPSFSTKWAWKAVAKAPWRHIAWRVKISAWKASEKTRMQLRYSGALALGAERARTEEQAEEVAGDDALRSRLVPLEQRLEGADPGGA